MSTSGTSGTGGKVLGLGCGQPHGSAEILLKAALRAAEDEGAEVELVRLDELRLPSGAAEAAEPDDAWWLWERLVECDGLIVSTPIISRTVAARLKLLGDRLLGPNADAAIIAGLLALRRQGREPAVPFRVDERVLKPRVAGFLAVGGSLTPQWKTLTLPIMHTTTFSMHIAVVDQVQFAGAGTPCSVVLDAAALDRAAVLGRNVASQLGVAFDEARYLGPPGLCPMCHLDVIALHGADVECATCGARGQLGPGHQVTWTDLSTSVISMEEKQAHAVEIQETAERHRELRPEIDERARAFEAYDRTVRPGRTPASGLSVRRHYLRPRPRAHHHRRRRRPDLEPSTAVGSRKKFVNDSNRNSKDGILVPKPPSFFSSEREVVHVLTHVPHPRPGRPRSGRRERRRPAVPAVPAVPGNPGALR